MSRKINLNILGYEIYVLIYAITVSLYGFGNSIANLRYYSLAALLVCSLIFIIIKRDTIKEYKQTNLLYSIGLAIIFLVFSVYRAHQVNISLNIRTFVQISLFLFPTLYAFFVINLIEKEKIIYMMKITTIFLVIVYFFDFQEQRHSLMEFFKIDNWTSIDYFKSNSFTESHNWSESFLQLFLFFLYFYKTCPIGKEKSNLRIYLIITFIFTMLGFKRLGMLVAFFFLIFGSKIIKMKSMKKNHALLLAITFSVCTLLYTNFMQGKLVSYDTIFNLTSGRNWILEMWSFSNYLSYGYGSSMLVIGRYLEMDLVQIFLELNIFCVFLFCYFYFRCGGKSYYTNLILMYSFFNMLTSSSLPWQISWIIMMLSITLIREDSEQRYIENNKNTDIAIRNKFQTILDKIYNY